MTDSVSETIRSLVLLTAHTTIVHHIPGRIRIRVLPSGVAIARRIDFDKVRAHLTGILGVRVNPVVGSVVIEYDSNRLSPKLWEDLAGNEATPERISSLETTLSALWTE